MGARPAHLASHQARGRRPAGERPVGEELGQEDEPRGGAHGQAAPERGPPGPPGQALGGQEAGGEEEEEAVLLANESGQTARGPGQRPVEGAGFGPRRRSQPEPDQERHREHARGMREGGGDRHVVEERRRQPQGPDRQRRRRLRDGAMPA